MIEDKDKTDGNITHIDALLKFLNQAAVSLLSINDEKQFEISLNEIMALLGGSAGARSVHLWRITSENEKQFLYHYYEWHKETGGQKKEIPLNASIPCDAFPELEKIIEKRELVNCPLSVMPEDIRILFNQYNAEFISVIPLFLHNSFWGMLTLENSLDDKTPSLLNQKINALQLAGLMLINAVLRNETLRNVKEEHDKLEKLAHWYHSILDAVPLPISVTDPDMKWKFVNMAVENFLGAKRADMLGKHCSGWNAHICNTSKCGIACVKRGRKQTYFNQNNLSFKVDVEILKDLNNETAGYIEIVQDVTNIETMAKRQAEAESASKAKSSFLANMSHEMRTPMNAILGIAEIQLQSDSLAHNAAEAFAQIYESGDLLLNIINDILDLSKIEAGKFEIASAKYDIPSLINDTVQLNRLRYESSPIEFILKIDENTPHDLQGDELRIKQILNNILSNAFKYTNKGYVKLSVTFEPIDADNVMMIFIVTDSGQGMTGSQIEKLFDEYTRFNAEANRDTVGTGLGMSITKHLVEMMNGTISVKSEPSSGSVFTVRIPQKRMGTAVCGSEMEKKLLGLRLQSSVINKKTRFIREYMPYGSVLLVDDVESNLYVAKGLLSPYSLSIDTAINGFEVLDKIKNGNVYDIIFMDHMMPKMDGMEAVRIIRDMGYDSAIIALTANVLIGQEKMFMENGFDGFISKPIDSRELNQILNDFIRNKKPSEVVQAARAAQQSAASSRQQNVQPVSPIIPNLNVKKLKQFFIEDAKNAVTVLEYLLKNITSLDKEELELYIITVHGIKSALANIGEKELSGFALKLENAGNEKLYDVMKEGTPVLINILKSFINTNLSEILKNNDVNNEENEYDFSYLYVKLNEFKDACAKFDKQNVNAVLNDLKQKKWPSNIKNLLEELSLDITHSAFKKAIAAADRIPLK